MLSVTEIRNLRSVIASIGPPLLLGHPTAAIYIYTPKYSIMQVSFSITLRSGYLL